MAVKRFWDATSELKPVTCLLPTTLIKQMLCSAPARQHSFHHLCSAEESASHYVVVLTHVFHSAQHAHLTERLQLPEQC